MRALEFHGPGDMHLVSREDLPDPKGHDVLFRPTLAGICGTDRAIYLGHYNCTPPRVLGHEAIGIVEAIGDEVDGLAPGDRVILDPTQSCGTCRRCLRGETSHCLNKGPLEVGVGRDGAFRDSMLIESKALHRLSNQLTDRQAVLIEPLTCVLNAMEKSGLSPRDRVTVIGGGPMGVLAAMVAQRSAAWVEVVESDAYRTEFLTDIVQLNVRDTVAIEDVDNTTNLVVDTTGTQCRAAMDLVDDGGRVCLMGCSTEAELSLRPFELTGRCVSLVGSCDYHSSMFSTAIEYMTSLDCAALASHEVPLNSYEDAFELLAIQPGAAYQAGKVVLRIN